MFVAAGTGAQADGVVNLPLYGDIIKATVKKVEPVVAPAAAVARRLDVTLAAAVSVGSTFKFTIFGVNVGLHGALPLTVTVIANSTVLATFRGQVVAALNARLNPMFSAQLVGTAIQITGPADGTSFQFQAWTDDPATTIAVAVGVVGTAAIGQNAQLLAFMPERAAVIGASTGHLVKIHREVVGDDGATRKQWIYAWCANVATANNLVALFTIGDTSAADESATAQVIDIS